MHTGYNFEIVPLVLLLNGTTFLQVKAVTLDYEMWTRCTGYLDTQERGHDRHGPFKKSVGADRRDL